MDNPIGSREQVNVLLIDDSVDSLFAMEAVLEDTRGTLFRATSGGEALHWLTAQDCAVVVLDLRIPDLDGFEVATRIRKLDRHRQTPIIFVTGFDEGRGTVERAYSLGAVDYLVKPVLPVVLRAKVSGFIELYRQSLRLRHQSDELARVNEQRFAGFMRHLPGLAWIKDLKGRYVYANESACQAFGTTAERLIGRTDKEIFDPATAATFSGNDRRAADCPGGIQVVETLVHPDGRRHYSHVTKFPITGGKGQIAFVGGVAIDVTESKQAEEALRRSEGRLRLLWESAAVLLTTEEPDTMLRQLFVKIGPQLEIDAYFNYMVNDSGDAMWLASCAGIPDETARSMTRMEPGQTICGGTANDGQPIVASHIQDSGDSDANRARSLGLHACVCIPLVLRDFQIGTLSFGSRTRNQFEPEELDFLQTICHYVTVAYEKNRLVNQLKKADRRKNEFLATLSHELRNPLAPIRNAIEFLRMRGLPDLELENARDLIDRQVRQITRLVDDLLEVSRITQGKVHLRKERMTLSAAVENAVEAVRPLIEEFDHDLDVILPPEAIHVEADPTRLTQVILNLLNNAAKYTERGGRISLTAESRDGEAIVSVRDTGIGISEEHLPHIFEIFSQPTPALDRSQGGLGIGLSLVEAIVTLHGGRVEARSDGPGKGSEFVIRFPVIGVGPVSPSETIEETQVSPRTTSRRILVVDDNQDAANSMAVLLRLMGHDIRVEFDGVEALRAAEEFRPELILLDIGLPKMNGYDVALSIRRQPWSANTVLIALTGWGNDDDKRRAKEAGFDHHMTKPVSPLEIEKRLSAMGGQRERR
jgi:PAS domain S-box-containing protein